MCVAATNYVALRELGLGYRFRARAGAIIISHPPDDSSIYGLLEEKMTHIHTVRLHGMAVINKLWLFGGHPPPDLLQ